MNKNKVRGLKEMRTLLFNPGPTNVSENVRKAVATRDICHRETEFFEVLSRINQNIIKILNGEGTHSAVLFIASGTGCNEAICANIHGKVLVINNGKYSDRICHILERYNVPLNRLKSPPLEPLDLDLVERELQKDPDITHIYAVHHETTTAALLPLQKLGELAKKYNKLLCTDSVSSLGGHKFDLQKDNVAFCAVSANKCLESFPGVSFVIGKTEEIKKLEGKSRSFYFDIYAQWKIGLKGEMPFTPAVQLIFALDVALKEFLAEGYENRVSRYKGLANQMRAGLKEVGLELVLLPGEMQGNILTAVKMPEGMDYWRVHDKLKERGITIYSGKSVLNQRMFRVATLGHINSDDVDWFLDNLKEVMKEEGLLKIKTAGYSTELQSENSTENSNEPYNKFIVEPTEKEIIDKAGIKKAVILVAGMGTRLSPLTNTQPKCLTEVNGKTILLNALEKLEQSGIKETILAIGYLGEKVKEAIGERFGNMKINYVENNIYDKTNNSYSLWLAIKDLNEGLLILEGDVFFEGKLIESLMAEKQEDVTTVEPYNSQLDGTFVSVGDDALVNSWTHKKDRPEGFTLWDKYKTINVHKFSKSFLENQILPTLKAHVEETGGIEPIEFIFKEIISKGGKINAYNANMIKWFEIDDLNDLKIAENIFSNLEERK